MKNKHLIALIEGAAMVALAIVLSMIPLMNMPFGGSITACSMLPIILVAYRRGTKWGLITAFAFAVSQMMLGVDNLRFGTSFAAVCAIIFLDYIFAFVVLGFAGFFRNKLSSQSSEIVLSVVTVCSLRFICHFISGCTVWAGVSIPEADGMIFSLGYNAAYMIPETIITLAGAWYLSRIIDFRMDKITSIRNQDHPLAVILDGCGLLALVVGVVTDALLIFKNLQTDEGYDWGALSGINLNVLIIVTASAAIIWAVLALISRHIKNVK